MPALAGGARIQMRVEGVAGRFLFWRSARGDYEELETRIWLDDSIAGDVTARQRGMLNGIECIFPLKIRCCPF